MIPLSNLERQREVLQKIVDEVTRRRLTPIAVFTLESLRPLSFLASQALVVLGPIVQPILSTAEYDVFCDALENRDNVDWMLDRLESAGS